MYYCKMLIPLEKWDILQRFIYFDILRDGVLNNNKAIIHLANYRGAVLHGIVKRCVIQIYNFELGVQEYPSVYYELNNYWDLGKRFAVLSSFQFNNQFHCQVY